MLNCIHLKFHEGGKAAAQVREERQRPRSGDCPLNGAVEIV